MIGAFGSLYASVSRRNHRNPLAGVTKDATSGKYWPSSATEWAKLLAVAGDTSGGPSLLWNLQETGSPTTVADAIGGFTGTVTAGTPALSFGQAVAGWSRTAVVTADSTTGNILTTSTSLPDLSTTSMLVLALVQPSKPSVSRHVLSIGTTAISADVTATPRPAINNGALTGGTHDPTGQVEPWWLLNDVTHSAQALFTLDDHIMATYSARAGKSFKLFATPPACSVLGLAAFFGSAAEKSAATIKAIDQTMAWAPTWT